MNTRVSPVNDYFFRYLFGKAGHEELTLNFINAVLTDSEAPTVAKIEILNPFNDKEDISAKESILDIKATDNKGRIYAIEMQTWDNNKSFVSRSIYYWAKVYSAQLEEGDKYTADKTKE